MTTHTDTKGLLKYTPDRYPTLPGGEAQYLTKELSNIANSIGKLVDVLKLIETRLNTNGLT